MNNKNISIELNEKYIKDLTILKLKRNYGFIEREEFRNELINLGINNGISDYAEMLTFIAFNVIVDRIEEMQGDDKVKLLFNEIVEVPYEEDFVSKSCDVVLLGKDVIEVITIVPAESNAIRLYEDMEIKLLGIGVLDKYLSRMECNKIRLITIQPNLDLCSIYETTVDRILHEYDFSLSFSKH